MSKFIIVAKDKPIYGDRITMWYGNERAIQSAGSANVGYAYQPLEFSLTEAAAEMRMIKASNGAPELSSTCEEAHP